MEYENMFKEDLISALESRYKEINELQDIVLDLQTHNNKLISEVSDLKDSLQEFENLRESCEIIKQVNILTTDEVAKIYYAIQDSHHFQHLDKFKPI